MSDDIQEKAAGVLKGLLERMGLSAEVEAHLDEGRVILDVTGDDVAVAIGAKGRTLDALQLMVARIVQRDATEPTHIVVDGAGYRERREETLRGMAHRMRSRALKTRRSVKIDEMTAAERRIIHMELREVSDVTTRSEGEGPDRVLIIEPASRGGPARRDNDGYPDGNF